jgi:hypothetical protein
VAFTFTASGPTLAQLTTRGARNLRTANRTAGRVIAKAGRKAMNDAAKSTGRRWYGRPLAVKFKVDSSPTVARVAFNPARGQAGGWAIAEAGASPHDIRPRGRRRGRGGRPAALLIAGLYATDAAHPGAGGARTWTKATRAVDKAVRPELVDVYDEAFDRG